MKFGEEYNNIIIVGLWNKYIFTPEWDKKFLFPKQEEELEVEFPLGYDSSQRVSGKELRIFLEGARLCIVCRKQNDQCFLSAKDLAMRIADYLPHTPVTGIGINFVLSQPTSEQLLTQIKVPDTESIVKNYGLIKSIQLTRELNLNGTAMFVRMDGDNDSLDFHFNFHFQVESLLKAKEMLIAKDILDLKNEAIKYLQTIYDLKLED